MKVFMCIGALAAVQLLAGVEGQSQQRCPAYHQGRGLCKGSEGCCTNGDKCFAYNSATSVCLFTCPDGWDCSRGSNCQKTSGWLLCKGNAGCCPKGTKCHAYNDRYSMCMASCPKGWACDSKPPQVAPRPSPPSSSSGDCGRLSFDTSKYDSHYPVMKEFMKAGVRGGIPCGLQTKARVRPGSSIQNAIDSAAKGGGGVVLLLAGDHRVTKELRMKSNVVLRGEGKGRTRLVITMRSSGKNVKAITANRVSKAGIENLTMFFSVPGYEPLDRNNYGEPNVKSPWPWVNGVKVKKGDRSRKTVKDSNLKVGFLKWDSCQDMWLLNCELLEAGTNPIFVDDKSSHITFKGNFINRSYYKGGSGNGYFDVRGQYILLLENKIRKIRHVSVWKGAKYVVIYKNDLEVDINFHGADKGSNLMEKNRSKLPHAHHWPNVATGGADRHHPPGKGNLIFNNDIDHKRRASLTAEDRRSVYTVTGFKKVEKRGRSPRGGTFFPMK